MVESIFGTILASPADREFTVKCSFMEIYMERVRDLLNRNIFADLAAGCNLPIHEDKVRGIHVKGLMEIFVSSVEEVYEVMRRGQLARAVNSTCELPFNLVMNAESSRSHSIFVMQITQKNTATGTIKCGKLSLVDLAGSEKVGKSGATGQTLEEAKKINKSLSSLGMVINALTDGKSTHIPYRDSKLTRILQESLGGNSRTTLIVNCSPSSFNETETQSSLRFGIRAKSIKNTAKINCEPSLTELKRSYRKAKSEIAALECTVKTLSEELEIWRAGKAVPQGAWLPIDLPSLAPAHFEAESVYNASFEFDPETSGIFVRENELSDQIAEKEQEIVAQRVLLEASAKELLASRAACSEFEFEIKEAHAALDKANRELAKQSYVNKEQLLSISSLSKSNEGLSSELVLQQFRIDDLERFSSEASKGRGISTSDSVEPSVDVYQEGISDNQTEDLAKMKLYAEL